MITFLTGLESEKKTETFVGMIRESARGGRRVTVIVPEQQAVVWERRLARALSPRDWLALDVVSFTRLANLAERRFGGLSYAPADKGARYLLMWRAIRAVAPLLRVYGECRNTAALVSSMQEVQSELERAGVDAAALGETADRLEAEDGASPLVDRLRDVALISAEYKSSFAGDFDDPANECEKLLSILKNHDLFSGSDVFIDSFYSLTAAESAVVREIFSQAKNVTMTFACPADKRADAPHLEHIRRFFVRMRSSCDARIVGIEDGGEPNERYAREREHLRRSLWDFGAAAMKAADGEGYVRTVSAADRCDEAEYAVARVRELVLGGAKYSDIAVIARSADKYVGVIDAAFADAGLPLSVSTRFRMANAPVVTFSLSAIAAVRSRFARDDVVSLISTGLTDLTEDEVSAFSRYTHVWSIDSRAAWRVGEWTMNPDGYKAVLGVRARRELDLANSAKIKIERILSPIEAAFEAGGATVRDACAALWSALEVCGASVRLNERAARLDSMGFRDAAAFMRRSLSELVSCLDTLVDILGNEPTDAANFASLLRQLASVRDVGVIPAGIDEVSFGAADRLRADHVKHVIVLGAIADEFPRTPGESPIFTDSDRVRMEGAGLVLSEDAEARAAMELFWFWRAVSIAERSVDIVVPQTVDLKSVEPSSGATRVMKLFPDAPRLVFSPDDALAALWTRRDAARFVSGDDPGSAALRLALASLGVEPDEISAEGEWDKIAPELAGRVFGRDVNTAYSRLEKYVKCAFSYYARYVLDLDDREKSRLSAVDVGNFVHSVLEKYLASGDVWDLSDDENSNLISSLAKDYVTGVFGGEPTPRVNYVIGRVVRTLEVVCGELRREFRGSKFRPVATEQPIGSAPGAIAPLPIPLGDGRNALIRGVIDRLDVWRDGDDAYVRVIDYKTGDKKLRDEDIALGLNLQTYLYLFSVCRCQPGELRDRILSGAKNVVPAGVMYFSARPQSVSSRRAVSEDEAKRLAAGTITRSGRFIPDERVLCAMDPELSGEFIPVRQKADGSLSGSIVGDGGFEAAKSAVESKVREIALSMLGGKSEALPLKAKGDALPCEYCSLAPVCRNFDGRCRYE